MAKPYSHALKYTLETLQLIIRRSSPCFPWSISPLRFVYTFRDFQSARRVKRLSGCPLVNFFDALDVLSTHVLFSSKTNTTYRKACCMSYKRLFQTRAYVNSLTSTLEFWPPPRFCWACIQRRVMAAEDTPCVEAICVSQGSVWQSRRSRADSETDFSTTRPKKT